MADSYLIIDGVVVPYSGGRKCNDTDAWRDATPLELQMQEQLAEHEHTIATQEDEIKALREALTALKAENETLRTALKDADNELDWLDEDMDTCDHSVGVCMCDYWNMRRKMKAALSKENSND